MLIAAAQSTSKEDSVCPIHQRAERRVKNLDQNRPVDVECSSHTGTCASDKLGPFDGDRRQQRRNVCAADLSGHIVLEERVRDRGTAVFAEKYRSTNGSDIGDERAAIDTDIGALYKDTASSFWRLICLQVHTGERHLSFNIDPLSQHRVRC